VALERCQRRQTHCSKCLSRLLEIGYCLQRAQIHILFTGCIYFGAQLNAERPRLPWQVPPGAHHPLHIQRPPRVRPARHRYLSCCRYAAAAPLPTAGIYTCCDNMLHGTVSQTVCVGITSLGTQYFASYYESFKAAMQGIKAHHHNLCLNTSYSRWSLRWKI
jgi:hypothetical protein